MIKRILALFIVIFGKTFCINAQNSKSILESLRMVEQQFKNKQYDEVIGISNKVLFDNTIEQDSCYFMLFEYKALSYYRKYQEDSATRVLLQGIELYEKFGKKDEVLADLYRSYLDIAGPGFLETFSYELSPYKSGSKEYDIERYKQYSINLLKMDVRIFASDFERYGRGFLDRIRWYKDGRRRQDSLVEAIAIEKELVKDVKVQPFDSYFNYLQTSVTGDVTQYKEIVKELELFLGERRSDLIEKWIDRCYNEIVYYYYSGGYIEAVAEYYRCYIGFLRSKNSEYIINRKKSNALSDNVLRYIAYLQSASRYGDVKSYCQEVMANKCFNDITKSKDFSTVSYDYYDDAYLSFVHGSEMVLLACENPQKRISPVSFRFIDEVYPHQMGGEVDYNMPYIFSNPDYMVGEVFQNLFEAKDDNELIHAIHQYLECDLSEIDYYVYNLDSIKNNTSFEEYLVYLGREYWEQDLLGFDVWFPCYVLSHAYYRSGDFDNAIKWQKIASEIVGDSSLVCLDMYNLDRDNYGIDRINFDFYNNIELAYFYLEAGRFDSSIEHYKKYTDFYLQVVSHLFKGSDTYKEKIWDMHRGKLDEILNDIIRGCAEYPPFGDMVLELSALQKGFLAWQKIALKNSVAESNNKKVKDVYDKKNNYDRNIELSYYNKQDKNSKDRAELFGGLADCEEELKSVLGSDNILDRTIVKTKEIKQSLASNDVYVDFIEVPLGDTINSANRISDKRFKFVTSPKMIEAKYEHCFYYAVLMRKNWDYPKVIYIGENIDSPLNDLIVYKLNGRDKKTEVEQVGVVNSIYMDTVLTHYIWDKIVSAGSIKEGDNIFYVPTGLLTKIGLENLSYGENALVSDRYKVYRLSSARELLKRKSRIDCGKDVCYGIGDLKYNDTKFAIDMNRKRSTAVSSMFSRDSLLPLFGSRAELAFLEETFGASATVTSGAAGTESHVLREINRLKPAVLHIGTHGFNCIDEELSAEEERFLFGDRDSYVSPMENSLYRTGLYMSTQKSGNSGNASEGIITAKEISMLDLSKTKLVVLSSCSSALGSVNSEGVYGLQRGLKLAGAESLLVSLWDVNDKSTELLMKEFYRQLLLGKTRREALLKAQEAVRNYDGDMNDNDIGEYRTFAAPYYWAGFVLIDGNE